MSEMFCRSCLEPDSGLSVCPHCGWNPVSVQENTLYLAPGTALQPPYRVARVLGHGGFGITYLGWDANLEIKVAIKEYLPREFACRKVENGQVNPINSSFALDFQTGLTRFLDEARMLAKFQQHPGIVSVLGFFRAYGTGYMVMEYVEGQTLVDYVKEWGKLSWTQTLDIFMQIMDALRAVHKAGLLHRDIAPDNIYICGDGRIKLLDFGAAGRTVDESIKSENQSRPAMVKSGFAAVEQYPDNGKQGPWTDVYSIAASIYFCLTGHRPPDALDRLRFDQLRPLSEFAVKIPLVAEQILAKALAIDSRHRPQTMTALQDLLLDLKDPTETVKPSLKPEANKQASGSRYWIRQNASQYLDRFRWILIIFGFFLIGGLYLTTQNTATTSLPISNTSNALEPRQELDQNSPPWLEPEMHQQQEIERQAREQLKQQQDAALLRFEAQARQEALAKPAVSEQIDPRQAEHLRSLCDEWGATMECNKK